MSFFNKKDKDKKASPILPKTSGFKTTSSLGKSSMFSKPSGSFISKLKNLSKKDIAMVVIGVSTLALAPVAEYYLSKPAQENLLTPGFGDRGSAGSSSIYEPGINSLSVGSPNGTGDVVTPLSVRDPLSLIRGDKKPASAAPITPPSNYRDTLKNVAKNSFSRAAKSAGAPVVVPKMQGGLRSMGSFASGGGSRTSGKIAKGVMLADAKKASSKAASGSMMGARGGADYKGVASTPRGSSKDAMEALRRKAGQSASHFSDGSATVGVTEAAKDAVELAGRGGSGQGGGKDYEGPSNSQTKNSHSWGGKQKDAAEKLADKLEDKEANAALDWKLWKKYEVPKMIATSFIENVIQKGLIEPIGEMVTNGVNGVLNLGGGGSPSEYACFVCTKYQQVNGVNVKCIQESILHGPSSDKKTIGSWRGCTEVRKVSSKPSSGATAPTVTPGGGNNTAVDTNAPMVDQIDSVPSTIVDSVGKTHLENYVATLTGVYKDIEKAKESDSPKEVVTHSQSLIKGFAGPGQLPIEDITQSIRASAQSFRNGALAEYNRDIIKSEADVREIKTRYDKVLANLDKVIAGEAKAKAKNGIIIDSTFLVSKAKDYKGLLQSHEGKFATANETIQYAKEAHTAYTGQTQTIERLASVICNNGGGECGDARGVVAEAQLVMDDKQEATFYEMKRNDIKKTFTVLTGFDSQIKPDAVTTPTGQLSGNNTLLAMAGDFRDAPEEENISPFVKAFEWVGADKITAVIKTKETEKAEKALWKEISPAVHEKTKALPQSQDPAKNFTALSLRNNEIVKDLNYIKMEPAAKAGSLGDITRQMDDANAEFGQHGISLDGTLPVDDSPAPIDEDDGNDNDNDDDDDANDENNQEAAVKDANRKISAVHKINEGKSRVADKYGDAVDSADGKLGCESTGCNLARENAAKHNINMGNINVKIAELENNDELSAQEKINKLEELQNDFKAEEKAFYGTSQSKIDANTCVNNRDSASGIHFALACSQIPNSRHLGKQEITNVYNINTSNQYSSTKVYMLVIGGKQYPAQFINGRWKIVKKGS